MSSDFRRTRSALGFGTTLRLFGLRTIQRMVDLKSLGRAHPTWIAPGVASDSAEPPEGVSPCCGVMSGLKLIVDQHQFWRCSRCGHLHVVVVEATEAMRAEASVW